MLVLLLQFMARTLTTQNMSFANIVVVEKYRFVEGFLSLSKKEAPLKIAQFTIHHVTQYVGK